MKNRLGINIVNINDSFRFRYDNKNCIFHGWTVKGRFIKDKIYGIGIEKRYKTV
jgi:hypothetical protein